MSKPAKRQLLDLLPQEQPAVTPPDTPPAGSGPGKAWASPHASRMIDRVRRRRREDEEALLLSLLHG